MQPAISPSPFRFVRSVEEYQSIRRLLLDQEHLALDLEAGNSNALALVCVAIRAPPKEGKAAEESIFIIDALARGMQVPLKELLEGPRGLITHGSNARLCSDQRALQGYGIDLSRVNLRFHDTQERHGSKISLQDLLEFHNIPTLPHEEELKKRYKNMMRNNFSAWHQLLFTRPLDEDVLAYAASDVRYLYRLAIAQRQPRPS